jgi:hypothetical protein
LSFNNSSRIGKFTKKPSQLQKQREERGAREVKLLVESGHGRTCPAVKPTSDPWSQLQLRLDPITVANKFPRWWFITTIIIIIRHQYNVVKSRGTTFERVSILKKIF